jgi:hypothetical protein
MNYICMIIAAVCFALGSIPTGIVGINFQCAGFFCVTLAYILGR